jgi:hypothetical protein
MSDTVTWLEELQRASFDGVNAATAGSFPSDHRLSGEVLLQVLTTRRNAVISTTRRDGRPHSTPGSFVLHDRAIWLPLLAHAARAKHIARQPWASIVIAEGQQDTHGVLIMEGPAEVVTNPGGDLVRAATEKLGSVAWIQSYIRVSPSRLLSYASAGWRV